MKLAAVATALCTAWLAPLVHAQTPAPAPLPPWLAPPTQSAPPPAAPPGPRAEPLAPAGSAAVGAPPAAPAEEAPETKAYVPFTLSGLYSARSVQRPVGSETVQFGVRFRIAPVRAVAKGELDDLARENPEFAEVLELAPQIDISEVEGASSDEIRAQFLAIPGLSPAQKAALENADFELAKPVLVTLLEVAQDPSDAVTFALSPYLRWHFSLFSAELCVPLVGLVAGDTTSFEAGNVAVDLRIGHHFLDEDRLGVSWGVSVGLPTAGGSAGALALTNALDGPLYLGRYLSFEPYVVAGVDLTYFVVQLDLGLSALAAVKDGLGPDGALYMRYGAGFTLTPGAVAALGIEFSGSVGLRQADAFETHLLTASLRFALGPVQPSIAVQLPFATTDSSSVGFYGGLPFGSPADINAMMRLDVSL